MTWTDEGMHIAQWMLAEYRKHDYLAQALAAREIRLMSAKLMCTKIATATGP
jgi:hypothetical protein